MADKLWTILGIIGMILVITWVLNTMGLMVDDSDLNGFNRSGLRVHTDHKTGCQYLSAVFGGVTPRVDLAGRIIVVLGRDPNDPNGGE